MASLPTLSCEDADIDSAIPGAASAIFFNHGQCCCAGSRLYVEKKAFDKVVDGMAQTAAKISVKPGFDPDSDMGPLVSEEQLNRVCSYLESGKKEGAKAVAGGERHGTEGYFVKPTVLVDTTENMKVVQEEIFGPVVTAIPFTDPDEVIDKANNSIYGLAAGVWSRDIKKANKIASKLRAGTVWINCYNVFDPAFRLAATSSPAGDAKWGTKCSSITRRLSPFALHFSAPVKWHIGSPLQRCNQGWSVRVEATMPRPSIFLAS